MARVLIIRGGAIGDFVLTLPLFEALRTAAPDVEIEVLGYVGIADLAVGRRHAQASRRVDGAEWAPLFSEKGELAPAEREYLRSFHRVFCVWPNAAGTIRDNLLRAGAREPASINPLPPERGGVHAVEHLARECARAGVAMPHVEPHLYPSERDRSWAERFMRVTGAGGKPLLGLNPGSGSRRKNWPAAGYAAVARWWIDRRLGNVLAVAGPADDAALEEWTAAMTGREFHVLRNESLPRVAAALERCEAFVGNDSGITHIAAAVRTPTVAIFGPTDPALWRPRAPRVEVVAAAGEGGLEGIAPGEIIERTEKVSAARRA